MVGKIIRNYEIESEIGSGGNGVVYRCRNIVTNETVAIKVIGPKSLEDPERLQRFRHEAKIASTLNHPGIVKVFDVGLETINGIPRDFIVMELVEGRTLADRIGGRPMAVAEALGFAIQISAALSAAHAANIIHRDVKPSNLIVNNFGIVKLADFGLAKRPANHQAETTSIQLDLTHDGTIVGSVAYMSPEQARGLPLDGRSDIFSFGSVFYEMLSGKPAFTGQTTADKLSAVLTSEPPDLMDIPAELWAMLARCLRKDLTRRWQSAAELRSALEDFRSSGSGNSTSTIRRTTSTRRAWLAAGTGVAAGLIPSAYLLTRKREPASFQKLTFRSGDITGARFAPGNFVAYTAKWDGGPNGLYTCQPGNREGRPVEVPPAMLLGVNPQNEAAVLLDGSSTLSVVALAGGEPRPRLERIADACWSPDGRQMAVSRRMEPGKFQIEYPVGTVLHRTDTRSAVNLRVSLSGSDLAFFEYDPSVGDFQLMVIRSGKRSTLSKGWRTTGGLIWASNGNEIWICAARNGEDPRIYGISLKGSERAIFQTPEWLHLHDIQPDGRLLVARTDSRLSIRAGFTKDLGFTGERGLSWLNASNVWDVCDRENLLVFVELNDGSSGNPSIFLRKFDGSPARSIGEGNRPSISPDAKRIACLRRMQNGAQVAILPAGPGEAVLIPQDANDSALIAEWVPDGEKILVHCTSGTYLMVPQPGAERKRISNPGIRATKTSPDGQFAAGIENGKVSRYSLTDRNGPVPITAAMETEQVVRWTRQGILAKRVQGRAWIVDAIDPVTGTRSRFREIVPSDVGAVLFEPLVFSSSAALYAYTVQQDSASLHLVSGVA